MAKLYKKNYETRQVDAQDGGGGRLRRTRAAVYGSPREVEASGPLRLAALAIESRADQTHRPGIGGAAEWDPIANVQVTFGLPRSNS